MGLHLPSSLLHRQGGGSLLGFLTKWSPELTCFSPVRPRHRHSASFTMLMLPALIAVGCDSRRPTKYLIPGNYIGWVRIEFGVKRASPLSREGGFILAAIPVSGRLYTSTRQEFGSAADEFYYDFGNRRQLLVVGQPRTGGMIWAGSSGTGSDGAIKPQSDEEYFVGTREQLEQFGWKLRKANRRGAIGEAAARQAASSGAR